MSKIVVKFGGSNLKSKNDLGKILNVIEQYKQQVIIVVSAFYGITDFLASRINQCLEERFDVNEIINDLRKKNEKIILENFEDIYLIRKTINQVDEVIVELEKFFLGIHYIKEIPEFLEDQILSSGEKISSIILHSLLESKGIRSELIFPEELPLITDGEFRNATVDFKASEKKVREKLSGSHTYVIPGFYGVSPSGKITLLGRGGSDYSAASIAKCVQADFLDIWKDVDGFMTGDPKLVENPVRLDKITYTEAAELAYFGAKILHPRTVEPLMEAHIPIRLFNINGILDNTQPVSYVNSEEVVMDGVVKSVTYSDEFCIIKLRGPGVGIKPGILAKVTGGLGKEKINISSVITSQIAINILLHNKDRSRALSVINNIELPAVNEIITLDDISLIAVVGQGMLDNHGVAARIFSAIARQKINIKISSSGASQVVSYLVVDRENRTLAVREIHNEFFSN